MDINDLNENIKENFKNISKVIQAHEIRHDHTFNSLIHITMLVEFLFKALEEKGIKIDLDAFEDFQKERVETIQETMKEMETNEELQEQVKQDFIKDGLDLTDD